MTGRYFGTDTPTEGYLVYTSRGATRTDTPLIETPQTVNVITRQQIADQGSRSINDALRYTPGAFTGLAGASKRQDVVSLRGFHAGDVNNMFLDGLRLMSDPGSYSNIQIDPFFLERIDVVKGPSSVLYGHAMPGGLVNYTTKKPLAEQQGDIQFYGGSFDTFGGGVDLTGPLPNKDWGSYRAIGKASTSDTQFDVVKRERYAIMPEVSLDLSDDTTLLLQAYIQHDPAGGFHGAVPYDLAVDNSRFGRTVEPSWVDQSRGNNKFDRDEKLFSYELTQHVNAHVTLHSHSRYADVETDLAQIYQIGFTAAPNDGATLSRFYSAVSTRTTAISAKGARSSRPSTIGSKTCCRMPAGNPGTATSAGPDRACSTAGDSASRAGRCRRSPPGPEGGRAGKTGCGPRRPAAARSASSRPHGCARGRSGAARPTRRARNRSKRRRCSRTRAAPAGSARPMHGPPARACARRAGKNRAPAPWSAAPACPARWFG